MPSDFVTFDFAAIRHTEEFISALNVTIAALALKDEPVVCQPQIFRKSQPLVIRGTTTLRKTSRKPALPCTPVLKHNQKESNDPQHQCSLLYPDTEQKLGKLGASKNQHSDRSKQ